MVCISCLQHVLMLQNMPKSIYKIDATLLIALRIDYSTCGQKRTYLAEVFLQRNAVSARARALTARALPTRAVGDAGGYAKDVERKSVLIT